MTTEKLWAPWRMAYIKNFKKQKGCLFCRASKSKKDKKNLIIYRSAHSFAMLNLYPYNNGHILVSPFRHVKTIELLSEAETLDLMETVKYVKSRLDKVLRPGGFNIGINVGRCAGAGIDKHMHVHVVPRWNGDVNFMPVISKTKIISQSLQALYGELMSEKP